MLDQIIKFSIKNKFIIAIMTLCLIVWGTVECHKTSQ
jgi:Cu/Ag efflux pump CusA